MDAHYELVQMWKRLSRDIALISFITVTLGLILFPGFIGLLHAIRPGALPLEPTETWAGQKAILLTGSLFAVIFGAFHALAQRRNPHGLKSEG